MLRLTIITFGGQMSDLSFLSSVIHRKVELEEMIEERILIFNELISEHFD